MPIVVLGVAINEVPIVAVVEINWATAKLVQHDKFDLMFDTRTARD